MRDHGGFEHNRHGLRILETLEYRYADFPGLNLSFEVRQAQAQHSKCRDAPEIMAYLADGQPLLEAQVVDAADSLAYNTHDVDDALGVGLIAVPDLQELPFWRKTVERVLGQHRHIGPLQFQPTVVRALIDWQVTDLLEHTRRLLKEHRIASVEDVRHCAVILAGPGREVLHLKSELEKFLAERVYQHHRVQRMAAKGRRIIIMLFDVFCSTPSLLPERYRQRAELEGLHQTVCDYLAGMTDRYAQDEYLRLFQPYVPV
jgi:dGTPase